MLPPWSKTTRVPSHKSSKMHKDHTNTHKTHTGNLGVKRGVEGQIWCEMGERGEGIFIGPKSDIQSKGVYVWCYYTMVQRLSRTSRYYLTVNLKSSRRLVLLRVRPLYYSQSTVYYLSVYVQWSRVCSLLISAKYCIFDPLLTYVCKALSVVNL